MKKIIMSGLQCCNLTKLSLKMKLSTLLLIVSVLNIQAGTYSQNTKITLNLESVDVMTVLKTIESLTEFKFLGNENVIDKNRVVSVNVKRQRVDKILEDLFSKTPVVFQMLDRQIILKINDSKNAKEPPLEEPNTKVQDREIKGQVIDSQDKLPLPGVNIIIENKNKGVQTDFDGYYAITAETGDILTFSFVGMKTTSVTVGDDDTIDVVMEVDVNVMDEVVVTALGLKRDVKSLGYAISKIKGEDLTIAGTSTNPVTALYGKAAGVGITTGAAGPTGAVDIKIRGAAGLESSANTRPLFVVDGMPIYDTGSNMATRGYDPLNSFDYGSGINDINAEDIESIEILKGAKASVLYGSEGANGVVLITSKKGKNTRGLGININKQYSWEAPHSYIDFQNEFGSGTDQYEMAYETLPDGSQGPREVIKTRYNFGPAFDGAPVKFIDGITRPYQAYPDNFIDLFKTGSNDITTVAISGGNEKSNMRLSYTNQEFKGILENNFQKKDVFNFSGTMHASDFATFEVNTNLYKIQTKNRYPNLGQIVAWGINRDYPFNAIKDLYKNEDGSRFDAEAQDWPGQYSPTYLMGFLWEQNENSDIDDKFHLITSLKATLKLTDKISFIGTAGIDYIDTDYTTKNAVVRFEPEISGGKYSYARNNTQVENFRGLLNIEQSFLDDRLKVYAFGGGEYKRTQFKNINVSSYGDFNYPDFWSINNGSDWPDAGSKGRVRGHSYGSKVMYSALGSATIQWDNEFYLEIQGRNDWSSTLAPGNNSYFYPGLGLSWNFTDRFDIPFIEYGKFRASWADVGRDAPGYYYAFQSYSSGTINNTDATTISAPSSLFAGDIKPERKREFEVGFDARFFERSRLETSFSFYTSNTYDQIMSVDLSRVTGASNIRINAGDVAQWGFELFAKAAVISTDKLKWDVSFTAAKQDSKVKKLYPGITSKTIGNVGSSIIVTAEENKPYGELLMYDYLRDPEGNRVIDNNGYHILDKSEFTRIANITPDLFGGITSDLFFKNFNFHVGIDYKYGASIFSRSNYYLLGMGIAEQSLKYRDEARGGLAYYIDGNTNEKVAWEHSQPAPADAALGRVYHDGVITEGVVNTGGTEDNPTYEPNTKILSSFEHYSTYINDLGQDYKPDNIHKNDYIKLREIAVSYTLPKKLVNKAGLEKLTISLNARNPFYIYKAIPNIDAESLLGTDSFVEDSFYPVARSFGLGVNMSF